MHGAPIRVRLFSSCKKEPTPETIRRGSTLALASVAGLKPTLEKRRARAPSLGTARAREALSFVATVVRRCCLQMLLADAVIRGQSFAGSCFADSGGERQTESAQRPGKFVQASSARFLAVVRVTRRRR